MCVILNVGDNMAKRIKKKKKTRLKIGRILFSLFFVFVICFLGFKFINFNSEKIVIKEYYVSSINNMVSIYVYDEETEKIQEIDTLYRGQKVKSSYKIKTINDINYVEIKDDNI